eukprot:NODE_9352_length_1430_cov_5.773599.p1 GENE.NODE_9352_length_1430_cov_5.773599~~NODE_9352_length_1430_cov_5.773599.p1  ORF type:complete len:371 (-),score=54.86 NODE_9352_length_1430_cov_5.773599:249-1361(-)
MWGALQWDARIDKIEKTTGCPLRSKEIKLVSSNGDTLFAGYGEYNLKEYACRDTRKIINIFNALSNAVEMKKGEIDRADKVYKFSTKLVDVFDGNASADSAKEGLHHIGVNADKMQVLQDMMDEPGFASHGAHPAKALVCLQVVGTIASIIWDFIGIKDPPAPQLEEIGDEVERRTSKIANEQRTKDLRKKSFKALKSAEEALMYFKEDFRNQVVKDTFEREATKARDMANDAMYDSFLAGGGEGSFDINGNTIYAAPMLYAQNATLNFMLLMMLNEIIPLHARAQILLNRIGQANRDLDKLFDIAHAEFNTYCCGEIKKEASLFYGSDIDSFNFEDHFGAPTLVSNFKALWNRFRIETKKTLLGRGRPQ